MIATRMLAVVAVAASLLSPVVAFAICGNGMVDLGEDCDGGACCDGDCDYQPPSHVCRGPADLCDFPETCTGSSASCPADTMQPSTFPCRPAGGPCDIPEFCDGVSFSCDADAKSVAICRPPVDACDATETCDGMNNACPADGVKAAGTTCRSSLGACDPAETCDGAANSCPADALEAVGTECRAVAGACDVAETCTGGPTCPANGFVAAGTVCNPSTGFCDPGESCTGNAAACPADAFEPDGTACNDGAPCTIADMCVSGSCVGDPMTCGDGIVQTGCGEQCDDDNAMSGDGCSSVCQSEAGLGCPVTPLVGCRQPFTPAKATVKIKDREQIGALKLIWKWKRGSATTVAEFGDPVNTTSYQLCVYDSNGLLTGSTAPAGGTCGVTNPKPCWKQRGDKGFKYRDNSQSIEPGGIKKLNLKAGRDGKAQIHLTATGGIFEFPSNGGLGLPDLAAIAQPFRLQLQNSTGLCFETLFSAPPSRQDPSRFEDIAD